MEKWPVWPPVAVLWSFVECGVRCSTWSGVHVVVVVEVVVACEVDLDVFVLPVNVAAVVGGNGVDWRYWWKW